MNYIVDNDFDDFSDIQIITDEEAYKWEETGYAKSIHHTKKSETIPYYQSKKKEPEKRNFLGLTEEETGIVIGVTIGAIVFLSLAVGLPLYAHWYMRQPF